jgi:hypothetical protein
LLDGVVLWDEIRRRSFGTGKPVQFSIAFQVPATESFKIVRSALAEQANISTINIFGDRDTLRYLFLQRDRFWESQNAKRRESRNHAPDFLCSPPLVAGFFMRGRMGGMNQAPNLMRTALSYLLFLFAAFAAVFACSCSQRVFDGS